MGKKRKFRKSMFGFKKSDVIDYIENTVSGYSDEISGRDQKIGELEKSLEEANQSNTELANKLHSIEDELASLRALAFEMKHRIDENKEMSQKIGEVYVEAKESAAEIISKATENAHTIVSVANNCARSTFSSISSAESDLDYAKQSLNAMMSEFDKKLDNISRSIKTAKSKIPESSFSVKDNITEDDLKKHSVIM